jgi:eukaryotic-like serine/threonine-protein kinase
MSRDRYCTKYWLVRSVTSAPLGRASAMVSPARTLLDGRYQLVEPLARGGMGTVWRAHDERLHRTVAVKLLDAEGLESTGSAVEARALAQLNHPRIANVFDFGEHEGQPYLVMEFVRGRSLSTVLGARPLSWPAVAAAGSQVAEALAAAHARGLIHRDVKPGNIMVTGSGATLIDFGISAIEGQSEAGGNGGFRGTPEYVAPERLRGQAVAAPADVYALGVVLYRALCGRPPNPAIPTGALHSGTDTGTPPRPVVDGLPPEVADLCAACLDPDPARRPDAASLAAGLAAAAGPEGAHELAALAAAPDSDEPTQLMAPPSTKDARHRPPVSRVAAAAAVVTAVLGVGWSAAHWSPLSDDVIPAAVGSPEALTPAEQPRCDVTFRLATDDGQRFSADIVATPRTEALQAGWRLALAVPLDGMSVDPASGWRPEGATLVSPAQPGVGAGTPARLGLTGSHTGAIALPTRMSADGRDCAVVLLASTPPPATAADQTAADHTAVHQTAPEAGTKPTAPPRLAPRPARPAGPPSGGVDNQQGDNENS